MLPNLEYSIRFKTFSPRWNTGTHVQESWYGPNSAVQLKVMQHVASVKRKLLGERLLVVNFRLFACSHRTICHLVYLKFCVIRWYNRGWTDVARVTNQHDEHGTEHSLNISTQTSNTNESWKQNDRPRKARTCTRKKAGFFRVPCKQSLYILAEKRV
jgi:hypothetical protein